MITPVLIDEHAFNESIPPHLGQHVRWRLLWNEPFARFWAALRPGWELTADLRPAQAETVTRLGATPDDNTLMQPAIASHGDLHIHYTAPIPVPETLTMSGAPRVTHGLAPRADRPQSLPLSRPEETVNTIGIVQRLQVVSILLDYRPSEFFPAWRSLEPIAGTEWFYDLTDPPEDLHSYRPRPREGDDGHLRIEVLLVDLVTE